MFSTHARNRLRTAVLLALLLIGGQSSVLLHAFEHDVATLQGQSCATCLTASQLGHGCIDTPGADPEPHREIAPFRPAAMSFASIATPVARQRGPPGTL